MIPWGPFKRTLTPRPFRRGAPVSLIVFIASPSSFTFSHRGTHSSPWNGLFVMTHNGRLFTVTSQRAFSRWAPRRLNRSTVWTLCWPAVPERRSLIFKGREIMKRMTYRRVRWQEHRQEKTVGPLLVKVRRGGGKKERIRGRAALHRFTVAPRQ